MQQGIFPPPSGGFQGASAHRDGLPGAVPAPKAGDHTKVLYGGGAWASLPIPSGNPAPLTAAEALADRDFVCIDPDSGKVEKLRGRSGSSSQMSAIGNYTCKAVLYLSAADRFVYILASGNDLYTVIGTPTYAAEQITSMSFGAVSAAFATDARGSMTDSECSAIWVESTSTIYVAYAMKDIHGGKVARLTYASGTVMYQNSFQHHTAIITVANVDLCWNALDGYIYLITSDAGQLFLYVLSATLSSQIGIRQTVETSGFSVIFGVCYNPATQRVYAAYTYNSGSMQIAGRIFSTSSGTVNMSARFVIGPAAALPCSRPVSHPTQARIYVAETNSGIRDISVSTTSMSQGGLKTQSGMSWPTKLFSDGILFYVARADNNAVYQLPTNGAIDSSVLHGATFAAGGDAGFASALVPGIRAVITAEVVSSTLYWRRLLYPRLNSEYFAGIALAAAAANASVLVALPGAVVTGLSGLTPGSFYYVTSSATLSTSNWGTRVPFGMALSATSAILMGGNRT